MERILILGVGNVLVTDEGFGVRVVKELLDRYEFPANVRVVDGGVLGLSLMGTMMEADKVVVVDAVRGGGEPGSIYRFPWDCKPEHIKYKDSLHQVDLMETMGSLPLVGAVPEVLVLGVEYQDIDTWQMALSPPVEAAVEPMIRLVLEELERLGAGASPRTGGEKLFHVLGDTGQSS